VENEEAVCFYTKATSTFSIEIPDLVRQDRIIIRAVDWPYQNLIGEDEPEPATSGATTSPEMTASPGNESAT
jgi:hypothetical protein